VADPVTGGLTIGLTIGAGTGSLSSLVLPCPCLDYLVQKGIFLNTESLELQYQFVDRVFGHSGQGRYQIAWKVCSLSFMLIPQPSNEDKLRIEGISN
jgi:hypothetical protein